MELWFGELLDKDFIAITKPPTRLSRASVALAILLAIIDRPVYALEDLNHPVCTMFAQGAVLILVQYELSHD